MRKVSTKKTAKLSAVLATMTAAMAFSIGAASFTSATSKTAAGTNALHNGATILKAGTTDAEGKYYYTSNYSSRSAVLTAGRKLSRQISGEGYVLLKNSESTLPLKKGNHITVFGKNSVYPAYSGGGSGGGPSGGRVDLYEALEETGFKVNPTMKAFYENTTLSGANRSISNYTMIGRTIGIPTYETPVSSYRATEKKSFDAYSDAAVIFISRYASEGADLSRSSWDMTTSYNSWTQQTSTDYSSGRAQVNDDGTIKTVAGRTDGNEHYLELDDNEKDMIKLAKASGFKKLVLVINSGNPLELDWVDSEDLGVDAALWMGNPGQAGFLALGDVLNGDVNPSGHLTDTYAKDFTKSPTYAFTGLGETGDDDGFYALSSAPNKPYASYAAAKAAMKDGETVIYNNGTGNAWIVDSATAAYVSAGKYYGGNGSTAYPVKATANEDGSYTVGTGSTATSYGTDNVYSYNRYVKYKDGIYVGYKYYETMGEILGNEWYQNAVKYPFGFGLSYTDFSWETVSSTINLSSPKAVSKIRVKVTNTGDVAGKDVVQLYAAVPYTAGGVEKAAQSLAAYGKTELLEPGESEIVELSFRAYDLASWDENLSHDSVTGGYVLDAGRYTFSLRTDSHTKKGVVDLTKDTSTALNITSDPSTGTLLKNQFDEAMNVANGKDFDVLTRDDMAKGQDYVLNNVLRADTEAERKINVNDIQYLRSSAYLNETYTTTGEAGKISLDELDKDKDYYKTTRPTTSAGHKKEDGTAYMFTDLIGVDPSTTEGAELYQKVVENVSVMELANLVGHGSHQIAAISSIDMPHQYQEDGPGGFNTQADTMAFCNNIVIASTWNVELAEEMGELMGEVALWEDIGGWYAPSVNIHKSEFAGRNFEYFSEDAILSGDMVAAQIRGANTKGLMCTLKHFALNEQETDRGRSNDGVCTYADEQTIREIYLKPFETAVKEGEATCIMGSFNRIGNIWASYYDPMNNDVLRDEWGFMGAIITDASSGQYMRNDAMLRGGTDYDLGSHWVIGTDGSDDGSNISNTTVYLMQEAAKHIFYAVARSNAINEVLGYIGTDGNFHTTNDLHQAEGTSRNNYFELDLASDTTLADISAQIAALQEAIDALSGTATEDDINTINQSIAALQSKVSALETSDDTADLNSQIDALKTEVANLKNEEAPASPALAISIVGLVLAAVSLVGAAVLFLRKKNS